MEDAEIGELTGGEIRKIADMKSFIGKGLKFYGESRTVFVWGIRCEKDELFRRLFAIYSNYGAKSFEELISGLVENLRVAMNERGMGNYNHEILNELLSEIEQQTMEEVRFDLRFIRSIKILNPPKGTLIGVLNQAMQEGHNVEIIDSIREFGVKGVVVSLTKDRKCFYEISYDLDKIKTWMKRELDGLIEEKLGSGKTDELIDKENLKKLILYKEFKNCRRSGLNPLAVMLWRIGRREEAIMEYRLGGKSINSFIKKIILFLVLLISIPPFIYLNEYSGLIIRISALSFGFLMLFFSGKEKLKNEEIKYDGFTISKRDLEENFSYFRDTLRKLVEDKCAKILGERKMISEKEIKDAKDLETLIEKIVEGYFSSPIIKNFGVRS
ncbi:MAG: hypothetical protein QW540_10565 [Archaeoglobaceae archaeon]